MVKNIIYVVLFSAIVQGSFIFSSQPGSGMECSAVGGFEAGIPSGMSDPSGQARSRIAAPSPVAKLPKKSEENVVSKNEPNPCQAKEKTNCCC